MIAYEMMFILNPELGEEEIEAVIERLQTIIQTGGGEITNLDKWGKRRLAYEVKKFQEGYYVLLNFKSPSAVASEVERVVKISDNIIRYLLIRDEKAGRRPEEVGKE